MKADVFPLLKTRSRPQAKIPKTAMPRERRTAKRKDRPHLAVVGEQPCCICGAPGPSEVHHPRDAESTACAGRKATDREGLPFCYPCHRGPAGVHRWPGGEGKFWKDHRKNPRVIAAQMCAISAGRPMP